MLVRSLVRLDASHLKNDASDADIVSDVERRFSVFWERIVVDEHAVAPAEVFDAQRVAGRGEEKLGVTAVNVAGILGRQFDVWAVIAAYVMSTDDEMVVGDEVLFSDDQALLDDELQSAAKIVRRGLVKRLLCAWHVEITRLRAES